MNIVILGPQGSGKTTQAKLLSDYLELPHIAIGRVLRSIVMNPDHPLYKKVYSDYKKGELVNDSIVNEVLCDSVSLALNEGGMILDGVPRRMSQYSLLDTALSNNSQKIDLVIYINTSIEESKKRLLSRAKIENRLDDTEEAINRRLSLYKQLTLPILKMYKDRGILKSVDGNKSIEDIFEEIKELVDEFRN